MSQMHILLFLFSDLFTGIFFFQKWEAKIYRSGELVDGMDDFFDGSRTLSWLKTHKTFAGELLGRCKRGKGTISLIVYRILYGYDSNLRRI